MFAVIKKAITKITLVTSLLLSGLAQAASITPCLTFINAQDYARAEIEAKKLIANPTHSHEEEFAGHACLGMTYAITGRLNDALPALQQAELLSQDTKELAAVYPLLAMCYMRLNDIEHALLYNHRARKVFRELDDKRGEGLTLMTLGEIERNRGNTHDALKLFNEALTLSLKEQHGSMLNGIALIHIGDGKFKEAISELKEAIEIETNRDNAHAAARWRINLGSALGAAKQYTRAKQELLSGLKVVRLLGDKASEAEALSQLGYLATYKKNPKIDIAEARQWLEKAGVLYREIGNIASADEIANLLVEK